MARHGPPFLGFFFSLETPDLARAATICKAASKVKKPPITAAAYLAVGFQASKRKEAMIQIFWKPKKKLESLDVCIT